MRHKIWNWSEDGGIHAAANGKKRFYEIKR
jgi:hypothetical protein